MIEKSAGSSFTDSLPCGRPPWLLDPAAVVELAAFVDVLLSCPVAVSAPHAPVITRPAANASVAAPRASVFTLFASTIFSCPFEGATVAPDCPNHMRRI